MTKRRRRKCLNCRRLFRPDPRNVRHQRYCSAVVYRKASKVVSQARWLAKPQNRSCYQGPEHEAGCGLVGGQPGLCATGPACVTRTPTRKPLF